MCNNIIRHKRSELLSLLKIHWLWLVLWYLMPLSTIVQLSFRPVLLVEETKVTEELYHIILYRLHLI